MQNFVKIDTGFSHSTGIIFSCEGLNGESLFLVLTTKHLLNSSDLKNHIDKLNTDNDFDKLTRYFKFTIEGEDGTLIDGAKIKGMYYDQYYGLPHDILGFLITINHEGTTFDNAIYPGVLKHTEVFLEGYPGILSEEQVSETIRLSGCHHKMKSGQEGVKRYNINDSYHHYDHLNDLSIFTGLSGSPLKTILKEREYILGMNVSLPSQRKGENPFKLMYYLEIQYILEYLRNNGVIIYDMADDDVKIKWIYNACANNSRKRVNVDEGKTLLMFGGSGAGKTSFIKSFALHGYLLDGTGDGQTTRSNIYYDFSRFDEFKVKVTFLDQEEFVKQRLDDINLDLIEFMFHNCFEGMKEYSIYNNYNDYYIFMKQLRKRINASPKKEEYDIKLLEYIEKEVMEGFDFDYDKRSDLESTVISKVYKSYMGLFGIPGEQKYYTSGDVDEHKNLLDILFKKKGLFDINEFKFIIDDYVQLDNEEDLFDKNQEPCESFIVLNLIKYAFGNYSGDIDSETKIYMGLLIMDLSIGRDSKISKFFECVYDILEKTLSNYVAKNKLKDGVACKNRILKEIEFGREIENDSTKLEFLVKCLKVHESPSEKSSVTSLIKKVEVTDSLSNDYVYMLDRMKVTKIRFIDTKGLDHIEKGVIKAEEIQKTIQNEKEKKENDFKEVFYSDGIDAIVYLKKLDSGKPSELESIVPIINRIAPQIPIYVGFTGIDIIHNDLNGNKIVWNPDDKKIPKAVSFILSNEGEAIIKSGVNSNTKMKNTFYDVLKNNLFAFYGKDEKREGYLNNNKFYIKKLMRSIIIKEYNTLTYVPIRVIDDKCFKSVIASKLTIFFEIAQKKAHGYDHGQTIKANFNHITIHKSFGHLSSKRSRLDLILCDTFNEVFSHGNVLGSELVGKVYVDKINAIIRNMKNKFLGSSEQLYKIDRRRNPENECFSDILNQAYEQAEDAINPYDIAYSYFLSVYVQNINGLVKQGMDGTIFMINEEMKDFAKRLHAIIPDDLQANWSLENHVEEWLGLLDEELNGWRGKFKGWLGNSFALKERELVEQTENFFMTENIYLGEIRGILNNFRSMWNVVRYVYRNDINRLVSDIPAICENGGEGAELFKIEMDRFEEKRAGFENKDYRQIRRYYVEKVFSLSDIVSSDTTHCYIDVFTDFFIKTLRTAIVDDGKDLIENIINVDEGVKGSLNIILKSYNELTGGATKDVNTLFMDILNISTRN